MKIIAEHLTKPWKIAETEHGIMTIYPAGESPSNDMDWAIAVLHRLLLAERGRADSKQGLLDRVREALGLSVGSGVHGRADDDPAIDIAAREMHDWVEKLENYLTSCDKSLPEDVQHGQGFMEKLRMLRESREYWKERAEKAEAAHRASLAVNGFQELANVDNALIEAGAPETDAAGEFLATEDKVAALKARIVELEAKLAKCDHPRPVPVATKDMIAAADRVCNGHIEEEWLEKVINAALGAVAAIEKECKP